MEGQGIESIVDARKKAAIPFRLQKGASHLGRLYREGQRCPSSWSRVCPCQTPNDFCLVKRQWIQLLEEYYNGPPFGLSGNEPFYVIESMTVSQFRATGLTALVDVPHADTPIRVGVRGTTWKTLVDLAELQDDDAVLAVAVDAVLKLQKAEGLS
jgi:hypothetical protein